ncbi:MAG TPA: DegV family protein, partial [Erysipelotrichaceae bacterium]|nr:DegV family protein [Erysipelotrichaceae bacterium]
MTKSVLNQHPAIVIENGELKAKESYRGKLDKAVMNFIEDLKDDLLKAKSDAIFITDSGIDEEIREKVIETIKNLNHFEKIYVNQTGCVVSAHCGPQA